MWRSIASNGLTLIVVALVAAAAIVAWGRNEFVKPGPLTEAICVEVERGASLAAVSRHLQERGAIRDARIFRIGADYANRASDLKFGSYLIRPGLSMAEVLDAITASGQSTCGQEVNFRIGVARADVVLRELDPETQEFVDVAKFNPGEVSAPPDYLRATEAPDMRYRVTLAEGVTSWQVVEALKLADFLTGEVEAVPPEGSLSPDSYDVEKGSARADLLARMTEQQGRTLAELWAQRAEGLPYETPEEALIMASIIEKETGVAEERRRVASVFINRLNQGMRLQTDPTVIYGVTKGEGILGRGLRQSELRRETPYNTYVIEGLPPTPIANPGRLSIEAALNPETTDYLFFVADGTGGHAFAATLEKHNANVERWRAIEAARAAEGAGDGVTGVQGAD